MSCYVFIGARAAAANHLLQGVAGDTQFIARDASRDGSGQIAATPSSIPDRSAIHVTPHGFAGAFRPRATTLSNGNLTHNQTQLAGIGICLTKSEARL